MNPLSPATADEAALEAIQKLESENVIIPEIEPAPPEPTPTSTEVYEPVVEIPAEPVVEPPVVARPTPIPLPTPQPAEPEPKAIAELPATPVPAQPAMPTEPEPQPEPEPVNAAGLPYSPINRKMRESLKKEPPIHSGFHPFRKMKRPSKSSVYAFVIILTLIIIGAGGGFLAWQIFLAP